MSSHKVSIQLSKVPDSLGDKRLDGLLKRARRISFTRLMSTDPNNIQLPIPTHLLLTKSGEIYLFIYTLQNGDGLDTNLYAKTAEIFGPLDVNRNFRRQISLKYGWVDTQDPNERQLAYDKMNSLDVAFSYALDLRDLCASQRIALEAIAKCDMETLQRVCPAWQMA